VNRGFLIFVLLGFTACNYNHVKSVPGTGSGGGTFDPQKLDTPDYNTVQTMVLGPRCESCHNGSDGRSDFRGYANARKWLPQIVNRAAKVKDMPKTGPISENEIRLLLNWKAQGSPENVSLGQKPTDDLGEGPNNWTKIHDKIFVPKCMPCHAHQDPPPPPTDGTTPPVQDTRLDLDSVSEVRLHISDVFEHVIVKRDMPVPPLPTVTPSERDALYDWIDLGMPE
jgi:uncharacterized membrane protein